MRVRKEHSHQMGRAVVVKRLESAGLKKSKPRLMIIDALLKGDCPSTVEEVYKRCPGKAFDLVTLYRTLQAFEKIGLVHRYEFGDGVARFELAHDHHHHHHHVICKSCRKVERLRDCELENLEKAVSKMGYQQLSHSLEFFGLCNSCVGS